MLLNHHHPLEAPLAAVARSPGALGSVRPPGEETGLHHAAGVSGVRLAVAHDTPSTPSAFRLPDRSLAELIIMYLDHLSEESPQRVASTRSNLNRFARFLADDARATDLFGSLADKLDEFRKKVPVPPSGSYRAIKSQVLDLARWCYDEGLIAIADAVAARVGMPPREVFGGWREQPKALSVYKLVVAQMDLSGVSVEDLDHEFFEHIMAALPSQLEDWRGCWRAFGRRWDALADEGVLPEIEFPRPASKRPDSYRICEEDLPPPLRSEISLVRRRLLGGPIAERQGKVPYDISTVDLMMSALQRLLGFLAREARHDLATLSLADALRLEHAMALIHWTNERWRSRSGATADAEIGYGEYEFGQLVQLGSIVRVALRDNGLHAAYVAQIRFMGKSVRARREIRRAKPPGRIDDWYRVACMLCERAAHQLRGSKMKPRHAQLIRDALLFALLAAHASRESILAGLRLGVHARRSEDGSLLLCYRREGTKPGMRDLQLDVPPESLGLWNFYLTDARPVLAGGEPEHDFVFIGQGGKPLTASAIAAIVSSRTKDVLGARKNPHLARKALATDFAEWSKGDFLTISAVLDTSPNTLQRSYAHLDRQRLIKEFDAATRSTWGLSADAGGMP